MKTAWYNRLFVNMKDKQSLKAHRFQSDTLDVNRKNESKIFKKLFSQLVGNSKRGVKGLLESSYSENSGIMSILTRTYSPELSIALTNHFYQELSEFYVEKSVEKQLKTYEIIKNKHDSIHTELRSAEYALANFQDRNKGVFSSKSQLEESRLRNQLTILIATMVKATENLEVADFALQNKTPFIQHIDRPILPIESDRPPIISVFLFSCILGSLLAFIFIIGKKIWKESLNS